MRCSRVADQRFRHGAVVLHTDWAKSTLLTELIEVMERPTVRDVIGRTDYPAGRRGLRLAAEERGEVTIRFRKLDEHQWNRLRAGRDLATHNDVPRAAQLVYSARLRNSTAWYDWIRRRYSCGILTCSSCSWCG
jgi:hypothetical protein